MNFASYDLEVKRQLSDNVFYKKLSSDPTNVFKNDIQEILQEFANAGEITKQDYQLITQLHQSFIYFPKYIKTLLILQEDRLYLELGFSTFVDFF